MSKGGKPMPTAMKRLLGNPGRRPLNDREPKPRQVMPAMPAHVKADDEARREWKRMGKRLHKLGLVTEIDASALAAYCIAWSRWVRAEEELREEGLTITTSTGRLVRNPLLLAASDAMSQMLKLMVEFGMTPSSRSKVTVASAKEGDPFEDYLARGNN